LYEDRKSKWAPIHAFLSSPYTLATVFLFLCSANNNDNNNNSTAVTCGSVIKIQHASTDYYLHSAAKVSINSRGSGQQLVTFVSDSISKQNTFWWLRPAHHTLENTEYPPAKASCQLAEPIQCGTTLIRLTHQVTRKNLHSHAGIESVLSKQQEVTAHGSTEASDDGGDGGDNWWVECMDADADYWIQGAEIRLKHQETGKYLGTALSLEFNEKTCGARCPVMNHLETFGRTNQDSHSLLKTEQGIHLSL
jgi:dolichyl-phosphate-mannose--protein O-mannosyl transferase